MIVMEMRWRGVTPEQYEEAKRRVDWVGNPSGAGLVHIAWFEDGDLRCYDVWESDEAWQDFAQNRLIPVTSTLDIKTEPEVCYHEAHDVFIHPQTLAAV